MGAATNSDAELTRLLPLAIAGHLRCVSDQPVAEIVQWASQLHKINEINYLRAALSAALVSLIP